jgi:hypothetical protein
MFSSLISMFLDRWWRIWARSYGAWRGRPLPVLGGWPEQLLVAATGRPLAFVFVFFSVMIGWPEQLVVAGRREDLAFVFLFFL